MSVAGFSLFSQEVDDARSEQDISVLLSSDSNFVKLGPARRPLLSLDDDDHIFSRKGPAYGPGSSQ